MDLEEIARALVGVRIGGVPLSWDEALLLAARIIERCHIERCHCGSRKDK